MLTAALFVTLKFYCLPVSSGREEEHQRQATSRDEDVKVVIVYSRERPGRTILTMVSLQNRNLTWANLPK